MPVSYTHLDVYKRQAHTDAQIDSDGDAGNAARKSNNAEGNPFIFAFLPMWWEKDLKGKGRTIEDGANSRFNMTIGFPEGVDKAEGENWLFEKVVPILQAAPECTRVLASAVKKDINGCVMDWVLEIWFENQSGWYKMCIRDRFWRYRILHCIRCCGGCRKTTAWRFTIWNAVEGTGDITRLQRKVPYS